MWRSCVWNCCVACVDKDGCAKRHACQTESRSMLPHATPATQTATSAMPATQNEGRFHEVLQVPHRIEVGASKCHACHANSRGAHGNHARHQSQPSAISATPVVVCEYLCVRRDGRERTTKNENPIQRCGEIHPITIRTSIEVGFQIFRHRIFLWFSHISMREFTFAHGGSSAVMRPWGSSAKGGPQASGPTPGNLRRSVNVLLGKVENSAPLYRRIRSERASQALPSGQFMNLEIIVSLEENMRCIEQKQRPQPGWDIYQPHFQALDRVAWIRVALWCRC